MPKNASTKTLTKSPSFNSKSSFVEASDKDQMNPKRRNTTATIKRDTSNSKLRTSGSNSRLTTPRLSGDAKMSLMTKDIVAKGDIPNYAKK